MQPGQRRVTRRNLARLAAAGAGAALAVQGQSPIPPASQNSTGLTRHIAEFIVRTPFSDLPRAVIELGKKSILDGLGLTLVGSVAASGALVRAYLQSLGVAGGNATIAGSPLKSAVRFAAFANGIGIHADDYDDTQLAVAPDRVYGLLTHPTAPCLSAALAVAESRGASGRDLLLAYHLGVEV